MTRHWFKPKRNGYGATPTTWEGWAVTFAFVVFVIGMSYWRLQSGTASNADWFVWFAAILTATVVLIAVSYRKTDGAWRWQWGSQQNSKGE